MEQTSSVAGATWYPTFTNIETTSNDNSNGVTGDYINVIQSGTRDLTFQYGRDTISRHSGGGNISFLTGHVVRTTIDGNEVSSVSAAMRGISPTVTQANVKSTTAALQAVNATLNLTAGTTGGGQVMFLGMDITNSPDMVIAGNLSYIEARGDDLENITVGGNKRFIRYTGTQESDFGGIINVNTNLSEIENSATNKVVVTKEWVQGQGFLKSSINTAPASATDTGTTGEIRTDADFIYVCTATDTWKRTAIATW